jgi:hypothetical protein
MKMNKWVSEMEELSLGGRRRWLPVLLLLQTAVNGWNGITLCYWPWRFWEGPGLPAQT